MTQMSTCGLQAWRVGAGVGGFVVVTAGGVVRVVVGGGVVKVVVGGGVVRVVVGGFVVVTGGGMVGREGVGPGVVVGTLVVVGCPVYDGYVVVVTVVDGSGGGGAAGPFAGGDAGPRSGPPWFAASAVSFLDSCRRSGTTHTASPEKASRQTNPGLHVIGP